MKKLCKSRYDVKVDGVCAGIANYFGIDVTFVRILWILFAFTSTGIFLYIVCMLIMPRQPEIVVDEYSENNHN